MKEGIEVDDVHSQSHASLRLSPWFPWRSEKKKQMNVPYIVFRDPSARDSPQSKSIVHFTLIAWPNS